MTVPVRVTPFWEQYQRLKASHPDALLWTRMGDFYEMFEEDARTAARELHITLTSREFGKDQRVPMAGVPYHAADSYLARLIRKGYHVAICEQMTEAGHGLVEREVVRVVTPGTLAEPALLPQRANNYLAAVLWGEAGAGLAYVDVSTGEFSATELTGPEAAAELEAELRRLAPAECITPTEQAEPFALPGHRTTRDVWQFHEDAARERLLQHFQARSLEPFGCEGRSLATACAGAIISYVAQTNPALLPQLTSLRGYVPGDFMRLDGQTRRNLNITTGSHGGHEGSLLGILDATRTAIGARLLRRWLGQPLVALDPILRRQEIVAALVADDDLRGELRLLLEHVLDMERIIGRCRGGAATPRDLWSLHHSLDVARAVRLPDSRHVAEPLHALLADFDPCADVAELIAGAVAEPGSGRTIAPGFSDELDNRLDAAAADRTWITNLEQEERTRTGIKSLKVGVNKVFGYYIEVTHPNRPHVPDHYTRKQTVAGAERYITPELKETESRLLRASEDIEALERSLLAHLLRRVAREGERLLRVAARLAEIDLYCALAQIASQKGWVRPTLDTTRRLDVVGGRHPVVEAVLPFGSFLANNCVVDHDGPRLLLITGPNMAGKSTYLRQVALLTLLAQIGSFVPATSMRLGLVDRIFTRVGAHDDLAGGTSTFMVEMLETAMICRQATDRSLIVLDEVGRGTSTDDGRAIAHAVVEYLHDVTAARTLFATHFHELSTLAHSLSHLQCWTFAVVEHQGELAFTHHIVPGAADRSYGLHVARLAGLPPRVLARATALLAAPDREDDAAELAVSPGPFIVSERRERFTSTPSLPAERPPDPVAVQTTITSGEITQTSEPQASVSGAEILHLTRLARELALVDVARTTPIEAIVKLAELQQAARQLIQP